MLQFKDTNGAKESSEEVERLKWNLSNPDTNGAEESVLLVRCPHFRG